MGQKILVIEDEVNLGQAIKAFLEQYNYDVTATTGGEEAIQIIWDTPPDLILTDLLLPGVHGFDICKKVRADKQAKNIPIIAMTAVYKDAVYKMEASRLGMNDFIEKPLNFELLLKKIEAVLGPNTVPEELDSDDTGHEELEKQLLELQQNYAKQLPVKIMELEMLWDSICSEDSNQVRGQLSDFRRNVHRLTGSGATFGFKDLTENARQIEIIIDGIMASGMDSLVSRRERINILLDNLRHHPYVSTELEIIQQLKEQDKK